MRTNEKTPRASALGLALLLALSMSPTLAQNRPVENFSESDFLNALGGNASLMGKAFRPTAAPDSTTHACPEVMGSGTTLGGGETKNLVPQPFLADGARNVNLAINFVTNSDNVAQTSRGMLNNLARALMSDDMNRVTIAVAGHTDAKGPVENNLKLSCARAISVRNYLIARGVQPERLGAYGFGPNRPLENATVSTINRRVEIRRAN